MQDSGEEEEDLQPFAKLFQRLTGGCAGNDGTAPDRTSRAGAAKPKAAPANKRQSNSKRTNNTDGKSERGIDDRDHGSDDEPLVPAPAIKRPKAAAKGGPRANLKRNFDDAAAADEAGAPGAPSGTVPVDEEMNADDREVMNRFEPLVAELREMKPPGSSSDEASYAQWTKDCLSGLLKRYDLT